AANINCPSSRRVLDLRQLRRGGGNIRGKNECTENIQGGSGGQAVPLCAKTQPHGPRLHQPVWHHSSCCRIRGRQEAGRQAGHCRSTEPVRHHHTERRICLEQE